MGIPADLVCMRLSHFIKHNIEPILVEWEAFSRTMMPPAATMSVAELRDHARDILLVIAQDMDTAQSEGERQAKSLGQAKPPANESFSTVHGKLRQRSGFDLVQLGAEYRALRATVLRLWMPTVNAVDAVDGAGMVNAETLEDVVRFNEGIDQALAEALASYAQCVAHSRDTFLAVLGHDLRNPLSALGSCVQILGLTDEPIKKDKTLRIARRSVSAIDAMVTDLLEYTRTRLGRGLEVSPQPGNFAAVCQQAFDEVCAAHPQRAFRCEIAEEVPLAFDAHRMRQVLTNLLSNAVQHGDAAFPVTLVVQGHGAGVTEAGVAGVAGEAEVTVVVRNQGTPIPPEAMQVIFNPMVQVAPAPTELHERPSTSLGLGLFIAREIVTGHGGTIAVSSTAAEGTAFTVRLPCAAVRPAGQ
jgi:signal transduction histidine kinase